MAIGAVGSVGSRVRCRTVSIRSVGLLSRQQLGAQRDAPGVLLAELVHVRG